MTKLSKAAIFIFERNAPNPDVFTLQYNPETVSRDIKVNAIEGGTSSDTFRLGGAPTETIKMDCYLDATDDLEEGKEVALKYGVRHKLAALETLLYPKSKVIQLNTRLLSLGTIEILPAEGPFTVLVFGNRVTPIRLSGFSISEEFFDEKLNPIRATVSLDMAVLSYSDLERSHQGYAMFLSHQIDLEKLAGLGRMATPSSILSQKIAKV